MRLPHRHRYYTGALLASIALLGALAGAQDAEVAARAQARELLKEAASLLGEVGNRRGHEVVVAHLASVLARAADFEAAMAYARESPSEVARSLAFSELARHKARSADFVGARETVAAISDARRQASTLRLIATIQAQSKDFEGAVATASAIEPLGVSPHQAYGLIAFFRHQAGDSVGAARTMRRALAWMAQQPFDPGNPRVIIPRFTQLSEIASLHARVADVPGARETLAHMETLFTQLPENATKESIKMFVVRAMAATGDLAGAREFAETIKNPDARGQALAYLAAQQFQKGNLPAARHTLEEIDQSNAESNARLMIAFPQAGSGDLPGSLETAMAIPDPNLRAEALIALAASLAARGQATAALNALDLALEAAQQADPKKIEPGFSSQAASVQASTGRLLDAIARLREIADEEARANAAAHVAVAQSSEGDWQGALAWARADPSPLVRAAALVSIAEGILVRREREKRRAR